MKGAFTTAGDLEQSGRLAEPQLWRLLEDIPAAVAIVDTQMRYLFASRRWHLDYRLGEQPLTGRSHYDVFPEIPERWKEIHRACLAGATQRCEEEPFPRADGSTDWLRWEVRPWHDREGRVGGLIMLTEVVTARVDRERETRRNTEQFRALAENVPELFAYVDRDRIYRFVNRRYERWFGLDNERIVGRHLREVVGESAYAKIAPQVERVLDGSPTVFEETIPHHAGERRVVVRYSPHRGSAGIEGFYALITDVSQRHTTEEALRESEQRFELAVRGSSDGIWDWNIVDNEVYYSPRFEELLQFPPGTLRPTLQAWFERIHEADKQAVTDATRKHLREHGQFDLEYRLKTFTGSFRWFRCRGRAIRAENGRAIRMAGSLTDITEHRQALQQLARQRERMAVTLRSIADAVISTDARGRIDFLNPAAARLIGVADAESTYGLGITDVLHLVDELTGLPAPNPILACLEGEEQEEIAEVGLLDRSGRKLSIEDSVSAIRDSHGRIVGTVLVFRDVTEARRLSRQISHEARHDALTGLVNRHEFERLIDAAVEQAARGETEDTLCYLDLDQFKVVNDTVGHLAGDELLKQLTALLRAKVRRGDTLARLGGDEFGLLIRDCGPENAQGAAEKLRREVEEFRFYWEGKTFRVGVSIGLSVIDAATKDAQAVLRAADSACYAAKEAGRNRVHVHHDTDTVIRRRQGDMEWVFRVNQALDEDGFALYCQPIGSLCAEHTEAHHELLVRMLQPDGGTIAPGMFLPAAERFNLASRIDQWVIHKAFELLDRERHAARDGVWSINLSGQSLTDDEFLSFVEQEFERSGISGDRICFEITETMAIANLGRATRIIERLKARGCRFALDDFGSGLSSFGYLRSLPVDYLKIDGQFVRDMASDPVHQAMVRSINELGHVLGKKTVAEFVEDRETCALLRSIGVDFAQGYHIGRPQPIENVFSQPRLRLITSA